MEQHTRVFYQIHKFMFKNSISGQVKVDPVSTLERQSVQYYHSIIYMVKNLDFEIFFKILLKMEGIRRVRQ